MLTKEQQRGLEQARSRKCKVKFTQKQLDHFYKGIVFEEEMTSVRTLSDREKRLSIHLHLNGRCNSRLYFRIDKLISKDHKRLAIINPQ